MKKIVNKIIELYKKNKYIDYIIVIIVGLIMCIPLNKLQIIFSTHDGLIHLIRIKGTTSALAIGEFPPFIAPNYYMSAGYAMNIFYQPITAYIPAVFNLITRDLFIATKIFTAICILASGITMYHFTYQVTKKRSISIISASLYLIAPYRLGNIYRRFAMGEFTALAFMPLVFTGLYNLLEEDGKKHYYIAIGAILSILTHTLTAFYLAIFCVIYLLLNIKKLKNFQVIKKLCINLVFILLVTALFWIPLLEAKNSAEYVIFDNELMATKGEYAKESALELKTLIVGETDMNSTILLLGIPTIILALLTFYSFWEIDNKYKKFYIVFLVFSLVSLFMTTKYFPWEHMPNILCKIQFPWRLLGFFALFSSFICAINLYTLVNELTKKDILKIIIVGTVLVLSIIYSLQLANRYIIYLHKDYIGVDLLEDEGSFDFISLDYLPIRVVYREGSTKAYIRNRGNNAMVLSGQAEIIDEKKENLTFDLNIQNATKSTKIEFPFIYYPGYEITLNKNEELSKFKALESDNGYVMTILDEDLENATLEVEYKGSMLTKVSHLLSLAGFIALIVYIRFEKRNSKM